MAVTLRVSGLNSLSAAFAPITERMFAGVKVSGESAAYALVWEWGFATRVIKPGPKTVWGTNPAGEAKVLTLVAPTGYIRVNRERYREILREEVLATQLTKLPISEWQAAISGILDRTAERCAQVVSDAAPIDQGKLRSEIGPAYVGDSILTEE